MKPLTNVQLQELFINMEGLVFRVASILAQHSPATKSALQEVFDNWNKIVKDILKE